MDKVEKLFKMIEGIDAEMQQYHTRRLIYPMGVLRTLDEQHSFLEQSIPDGAKLVLMGVREYAWDTFKKGSQILVSFFV